MNLQFTKSIRISAVVHVVVVSLILIIPVIFTGFRKQSPSIPVEFTVAVPYAPPEPWVKPSPPASQPPQPDPEEVVVHREPGPTRAKSRTTKQQPAVQRSQTKVTRREIVQSVAPNRSSKALSQSEIRRLLAMGAKPGADTVIPDAEVRSFETIRSTLYNAWVQPSAEDAGGAVVEVEIQIGDGGTVKGWRVVKRSGVGILDASVARALQSVKSIPGLTPAFISRHGTVTIGFRVEQ